MLASGVDLTRVSVPLGLVAMVYEARPNVTADAAGICIRTGNACILRGGSLAYHSCAMISELLADAFLPAVVAVLHDHGVLIHGDEATCAACADAGLAEGDDYVAATEEDWGREYLALEMSVKVVTNEDEAIAHINRYGTMHSEAIVAEDEDACERFLDAVDASAVYANASTRFTDGGEFGLGAEIGISTQKLHARGPFAAVKISILIKM